MAVQPLTFYDIPGNAWPKKAWSPNCWKARYALNIKRVPYTTVWVEYPAIADTLKAAGVPPTGARAGRALYTCPALRDPNTGAALADSVKIAEYLDKTYPNPDTPTLLPPGTRGLQLGMRDAFEQRVRLNIHKSIIVRNIAQMNPESAAYYRASRAAMYGKPVEELAPPGSPARAAAHKDVLDGLRALGRWIDAEGGPFLTGKEPCFADCDVAAHLRWLTLVEGKDSGELWVAVNELDGGRWKAYAQLFEKWEATP